MIEIWAQIPNYEGVYDVSNWGRVRSVDRYVNGRWGPTFRRGKIRSFHTDKDGYHHLVLQGRHFRVARLVCEAFHGPPPFDDAQVNHKNGIKNDDRVENLEWVTQSENMTHAHEKLGKTNLSGSEHPNSVLTEDVVRYIRQHTELSCRALEKQLGVSHQTISKIRNYKAWQHC